MSSTETFGCNQCSKRLPSLGRYNQHLKTHTKPYQCGECVKGFALRSDLTRHVQARHRLGLARHDCGVTGCSFRAHRKDHILQHVRKCHPELPVGPPEAKSGRRRAKSHGLPTSNLLGALFHDQSNLSLSSPHTLMQAASAGNIELVQAIMQSGVDVSMQADDGSTALHCAAKTDQTDILHFLIELGAQLDVVNSKGRTALHEAMMGHRTSAFGILVEAGASITKEVLRATLESDQSELFQTAWAHSSREMFTTIGRELFDEAASSTKTKAMATFLSLPEVTQQWISEKGKPILSRMILKDHTAMLECLLQSGKLDTNMCCTRYRDMSDGKSLIYFAAAKGRTKIVELLLGSETINPNSLSKDSMSPLAFAAARGHLHIAEKLLQHPGIIIDGNNERRQETTTPLHLACRKGHVEIIRMMLKAFDDRGHDIDSFDRSSPRMTPLQNAVHFGHLKAAELLLLRQDVDVNRIVPSSQKSLGQVAAQRGHAATLSMLLADSRVDRDDARNGRHSLLFEAILGGHWCLTEVLLNYQKSPLHIVCRDLTCVERWSNNCIDVLRKYLADVAWLQSQAGSLWHGVARNGNLSLAMLLLEHSQTHIPTEPSVDVNRKDAFGRTPLHVAAISGKLGVIELLLHHKYIDINLTTERRAHKPSQSVIQIIKEKSRSNYWYSREEESSYIVDVLLAHGAQDVSQDRVDDMNNLVNPTSPGNTERKDYHFTGQSDDIRWETNVSRAPVVGVLDNGVECGGTRIEENSVMGDIIPIDVEDLAGEDPQTEFKEWMCFDDEETSDNNSSQMWEREMSLE